MISQAAIVHSGNVLMVKQKVQRGAVVWNFPGGGVEPNETPEQACTREVKEETGYTVEIQALLQKSPSKYTFLAGVKGGGLFIDRTLPENEDIFEAKWIALDDIDKFDSYTWPVINRILQRKRESEAQLQ
ncbi:NUDIX hydrolase [Pseudalkalibacillus caeni]|uniref:NUDIX hydrolase n=1 Tax=Exobacillus caeni TaxID=2574798 RepID=A0A5R9FC83_9BACL|nr:NUDIX hydrolase [Pseudalkalibacillus caeni]TLS37265.1 NUDIX hydrolase [Pseudalkalibacillus caeni]